MIPDLMESALDTLERQQRRERLELVARAPEIDAIQHTLEAVEAAGLLLLVTRFDFAPETSPLPRLPSEAATVLAEAAAFAEPVYAHTLTGAGFEWVSRNALQLPGDLWTHRDGWHLVINWLQAKPNEPIHTHPAEQEAA